MLTVLSLHPPRSPPPSSSPLGPEDDLDNDRQPEDLDSSSDEGSMVTTARTYNSDL